MSRLEEPKGDETYPVRVASRLTGLKPELIRAWESRYEAIQPARTAGGSRRYSVEDLRRLRLLRDVVDAGHRIGRIAGLTLGELEELVSPVSGPESSLTDQIIGVSEKLDAFETRELLAGLLSERGPAAFATQVAVPLLVEIGLRWRRGDLSIAVEHFASGIIRSLLIPRLGSSDSAGVGSRVVFATPSGEPHDLGTLISALLSVSVGVDVIFLGADVPADEIARCVVGSRAAGVVLGVVTLSKDEAEQQIRACRRQLPENVGVWIGGPGITVLTPIKGVRRVLNFDQLQADMTLLTGGITDGSLSSASQRRVIK
jgi:DNA-binding transcriptional MerR regulator/methylmalonyl-CoA mutase cobalamin-binding subunit